MSPRPIRVLIADGDADQRRSLAALIAASPALELSGVAATVADALAMAADAGPDVGLVDVGLDGDSGERLTRALCRGVAGSVPVVAFGRSADRYDVVAMLRAGAIGYLTRDSLETDVVDALIAAAEGRRTISPAATPALVEELAHHLDAQERILDEERRRLARVRELLDRELLETVFQPIVAVDTRERAGYEALTRVSLDPQRSPDQWFAEAWRVGLGTELEVLAVRVALSHLGRLPPWAYLAVNVSPDVVASGQLADVVGAVDSSRVVLEMTEHAAVQDYDRLAEALRPLRSAGARVSVDDTGAGFASLRHILLLDPDFIKLDGSITRNIDKDRARHALARGLVSFATDINAHMVGEGVETESELDVLRRLGISSAQGYLFGRPGPLPSSNLRQ